MKRLILAGFDASTTQRVQTRLESVNVTNYSWEEMCRGLPVECDLLVLNDPGNGVQSLEYLQTRSESVPVICCCAREPDAAVAACLSSRLGIRHLLHGTVDRADLECKIASALGLSDVSAAAARALAVLWQRFQGTIRERVQVVDDAAAALDQGALSDELRQKAGEAAHKLAGSLGTFGFHRGSALAVELEETLLPGTPLRQKDAARLGKMVAEMRKELDRPPGA